MTNIYTEKEIKFIEENYSKYGATYCAKFINKSSETITAKARRMGIKKNGYGKHASMQNINPEQFYNIIKPEVAYFLGYFWADGYINYRMNKTSHCYKIALEIVSEDARDLNNVFDVMGKWSKVNRKRKENWKQTTTINTNSKDIYNFLKANGYDEKSNIEPTKILSKIPENLKHYFWRGYFDGDGGIAFAKKDEGRWKSIQFSSTHDYKWIELKKLFAIINVNIYNISNYIHPNKIHKSSKVIIQRKEEIIKLISYFFKSEIGLNKKTNKMKEFLIRFPADSTSNI